jgi:DNA-binding CsgD family transcriptional regulator
MLVLGAIIALNQGRPEYAAALTAQATATGMSPGPYPGMEPQVVTARLAQTSLWGEVDDRIERGYLMGAVFLAMHAAELVPDDEEGKRLRVLGAGMEGRLLPALAEYAAAAATQDEAALRASSEALTAAGALLYAVRADVTRCLLLRHQGRLAEAAELVAEAWRRSAPAGERTGLFERMQRDVGLSTREHEILQLLAVPLTTQDVARRLQMSVRTVETHVHNASRKLGVSGRDALVQAVTTWLQPSDL